MIKKYILILFIFCFFGLYSQDTVDDFKSFKAERHNAYDKTKAVFKLSLLFPAVGVEFRLAEKFSLDIATRLGFNFDYVRHSSGKFFFAYNVQPSFMLEPKWNYNIRKRNEKAQKTIKFTSNFLSLHSNLRLKISNNTVNVLRVGPAWGLQRNIGKHGYLKFKTGLAYVYVFDYSKILYTPIDLILNLQLGLMF